MKTQMKAQHTPGPWKATVETYPTIAGDTTIHSLGTEDCIASIPRQWINREANARLIAAAPEMLEALKVAREHLIRTDARHDSTGRPIDFSYVTKYAEAAIAKATEGTA